MSLLRLLPRAWLYPLLVLTALAVLPWDPQGPLDARDWSALTGMRLDYPWQGVFMEPLLAPAHLVMGAPDFRIALLSLSLWVVIAAMFAGAIPVGGWRGLRRGFSWALMALGVVVLYTAFMAFVHLPGWRLVVDGPDQVVADLQSHTFGSHDGLVSAEQNLRWHRLAGYDLVGITEHKDPRGSFATEDLAKSRPDLPAVLPGVEVRAEEEEFLLGLGLDRTRPVLSYQEHPERYAEAFIADVHAQGGAVIALAWLLEPHHVYKLAGLGLDGIELVNTGHPDIPDAVRAAMLQVAAQSRVVPVASTDWHGWSGFTRTWTVVRIPGAAGLAPAERAQAVLAKLRARDLAAVTPVAAGVMGPPGALRTVFAPVVEAVRYAGELAPARVASWWVWAILGAAAVRILRRRCSQSVVTLGLGILAGVATVLLWRASVLLAYREGGAAHPYAQDMGVPALALAMAALVIIMFFLVRQVNRRGDPTARPVGDHRRSG